jgi:hypothetical protein
MLNRPSASVPVDVSGSLGAWICSLSAGFTLDDLAVDLAGVAGVFPGVARELDSFASAAFDDGLETRFAGRTVISSSGSGVVGSPALPFPFVERGFLDFFADFSADAFGADSFDVAGFGAESFCTAWASSSGVARWDSVGMMFDAVMPTRTHGRAPAWQ